MKREKLTVEMVVNVFVNSDKHDGLSSWRAVSHV